MQKKDVHSLVLRQAVTLGPWVYTFPNAKLSVHVCLRIYVYIKMFRMIVNGLKICASDLPHSYVTTANIYAGQTSHMQWYILIHSHLLSLYMFLTCMQRRWTVWRRQRTEDKSETDTGDTTRGCSIAITNRNWEKQKIAKNIVGVWIDWAIATVHSRQLLVTAFWAFWACRRSLKSKADRWGQGMVWQGNPASHPKSTIAGPLVAIAFC